MQGAKFAFSALVCDDEQPSREKMKDMLTAIFRQMDKPLEVASAASAEELYALVGKAQKPFDFVLLDIELAPGQDGFKAAEFINQAGGGTKIIFVTNHEVYLRGGYTFQPFDFLFKDELEQRLPATMQKAVEDCIANRLTFVFDAEHGCQRALHFDDIVYIESDNIQTRVVLADSDYVWCRRSLKEWNSVLNLNFFQCHKRYIINLTRVQSFTPDRAALSYMDTGIPISKRRSAGLREALKRCTRELARYT